MKLRRSFNISCSTCEVGHLCLAKGLSPAAVSLLDQKIEHIKVFKPNEHLYLQDDKIEKIYAIHSGLCKDYNLDENGNIQVNEFYLPGDILGLEYLVKEKFQLNAVALKETIACVIPFNLLKNSEEIPNLKDRFFRILCDEIENYRSYAVQTNVKCRIVSFILNLIHRTNKREKCGLASKSYSKSVSIPMSYIDISNKIGISNATFSRILKELIDKKLFEIGDNTIFNVDIKRLEKILLK